MLFVGGGAGMAQIRSHIFDYMDRLHTDRKVNFWYGARLKREIFCVGDFDRLQQQNDSFR
jgi:Na+-transporting NADH:ubiquinone oxidoreductase subunit F